MNMRKFCSTREYYTCIQRTRECQGEIQCKYVVKLTKNFEQFEELKCRIKGNQSNFAYRCSSWYQYGVGIVEVLMKWINIFWVFCTKNHQTLHKAFKLNSMLSRSMKWKSLEPIWIVPRHLPSIIFIIIIVWQQTNSIQ